MKLLANEKIGVFIDWENTRLALEVLSSMRNERITIPWEKFVAFFNEHAPFVRFNLYGGHSDTAEWRKLKTRLQTLGFNLVIKNSQTIDRDTGVQVRKNTDVELTTDICFSERLYDHIVLFSGDGDFSYLVQTLKKRGLRFTVVSLSNLADWRSNSASKALMQSSDTFLQLEDFVSFLEEWEPRED